MDRLERFQIVFNRGTATYLAGETVYGYGLVVLRESILIETVCLEAVGEARVEWMTSSDIQASDEEVFNFTTALPIKGDKDLDDNPLLHTGSHYFPFEFALPSKLPSSFKGKHGRLRYYVRLTICSTGSPHHEKTGKFAVISLLDLNKEPDAALPAQNDTFETIGSWFCLSGTVMAAMKLPKKGYTLKEAIPVWAEVRNLSKRRLVSTSVSLIQTITYFSYRGRFSETVVLVTIHKGAVAPRSKQTWQRELLSVPTVAPSHLKGCRIIDIQYSLELCIKPAGLCRKIKVPVDIVIGTVGLRDKVDVSKVSFHPLPSPPSPDDSDQPLYPMLYDFTQEYLLLGDVSLWQHILPTAPPWDDADIP